MPAPRLQAIGTVRGPCVDRNCTHNDCNVIREMAAMECTYCGNVIGYEAGFYVISGHRYVHAECYKKALESGALNN